MESYLRDLALIPTIKESDQLKYFLGISNRFPELCGWKPTKNESVSRKYLKIIGDFLNKKSLSNSFQIQDETQPRRNHLTQSQSEYPARANLQSLDDEIQIPFKTQDKHSSASSHHKSMSKKSKSQDHCFYDNIDDIVHKFIHSTPSSFIRVKEPKRARNMYQSVDFGSITLKNQQTYSKLVL